MKFTNKTKLQTRTAQKVLGVMICIGVIMCLFLIGNADASTTISPIRIDKIQGFDSGSASFLNDSNYTSNITDGFGDNFIDFAIFNITFNLPTNFSNLTLWYDASTWNTTAGVTPSVYYEVMDGTGLSDSHPVWNGTGYAFTSKGSGLIKLGATNTASRIGFAENTQRINYTNNRFHHDLNNTKAGGNLIMSIHRIDDASNNPVFSGNNHRIELYEIWLTYDLDNNNPLINTNFTNGVTLTKTMASSFSHTFNINNSDLIGIGNVPSGTSEASACYYDLNNAGETRYDCTNGVWSNIAVTGIRLGANNITFAVYDDANHKASQSFNFTIQGNNFLQNSQTYNNQALSGGRESFLINISYDSSFFTAIASSFIYNNTSYTPVKTGSGNNLVYNATITIPNVASQQNKTFYWSFVLTNSSGGTTFNSTINNQTINTISIDNCTTNTQTILNFSLFDEDDRTKLNGTIEVAVNLYSYGTTTLVASFNGTFQYTTPSNTVRICMNNLNNTYTLNYQTKYYSNVSYQKEYKYGQALAINNNTAVQNIDLYDLLSSRSTIFNIILQASDLSNIENAIIDVQRQYLPINQFLSVESPQTDNSGTTVAHLVAEEIVYNFIVSKNGVLLGTFNNYLVKCQNIATGDCRINLNLIQSSTSLTDFSSYGNISLSFDLDRSARQLSLNFISIDNLVHNVSWNVIKNDGYGNTTICTNSQSGTAGSFICSIPISYGNTSLQAIVSSDGLFVSRSFFSLEDSSQNIFGGTRVVLGMLMYSTLTLLFLVHPIAIIFGSILGMGLAGAFHIVDGGTFLGNTAILAWFIIAGGIIIYHMRNKI